MKKESIKFTEEKIKEYFNIEEKIALIKNLIISLEEKKENFLYLYQNLILNFYFYLLIFPIDDMPKGSGDGTSYFESNIMKQIQDNEKMIKNIEEDILNQKDEIFRLEIKNAKMRNIINILRDDYKQMLELRYKKQETETYIADKLNLSKSQYHILRKRTLQSVYNMLIMHREI